MKFRTIFVSDRKQVSVPEGWKIEQVNMATPPTGKPQFAILLSLEKPLKPCSLGFKP